MYIKVNLITVPLSGIAVAKQTVHRRRQASRRAVSIIERCESVAWWIHLARK